MDKLKGFTEIAPYLTHPLVLIGFVLLLIFSVHKTLKIRSGRNATRIFWLMISSDWMRIAVKPM